MSSGIQMSPCIPVIWCLLVKKRSKFGRQVGWGQSECLKKVRELLSLLSLWINGNLHPPPLSIQPPAAEKAVPGAGFKSPVLVRFQALPFQLHRVQWVSPSVSQTWVWTVGRCISHPGWSAGPPSVSLLRPSEDISMHAFLHSSKGLEN